MIIRSRRLNEPGRERGNTAPIGERVETATIRPFQFGDAAILPSGGNSIFYNPPSSSTSSINFSMPRIPASSTGGPSPIQQAAQKTGYTGLISSFGGGDDGEVNTDDLVIEGIKFDDGTGTGSGTGLTAQQRIDNALKDTALRTSQFGTQQSAQDILNRLKTAGQIPTSIAEVIKNATTGQTDYVTKQFGNLMQLLQGQYGRAQDTTTAGYDALRNYLTQNVPTAYSSALQAAQAAPTPTIVNDIAQYMGGQGVSDTGAQPGLLAAQAAAQGGAANYENLLNILATQERQGQASRLAEEQMGRTLAGTNLGALLAQQQGVLTSSQLQALAQVQAQDAAARLRAQEQATAREQALQDALNSLIETGYTTATGTTPIIPTAPVITSPIQKLAALPITNNPTLKKDVAKFVAANPNASIAKIEKKFPRLAANIK
jgi:hypothetical protein